MKPTLPHAARAATLLALVLSFAPHARAQTATHAPPPSPSGASAPTGANASSRTGEVASSPAAAPVSSQNDEPSSAQQPAPAASPSPRDSGARRASPSKPSPESQFFKNVLRDQRAIWTSPFHLDRGDSRWLLPLGLSSVALLATDQETDEFTQTRTRARISRDISIAGSIYTTGATAAAFYLVGRATHNERARETGVLGAEALIDGGVVFSVLKNVTQRQRPGRDEGQGEFFDGGHSFPSGHATSAWALATVVANEYKSHRAVRVGSYALAAAVSVSRFTGRNHFLSDVLVGSAIGYGVGRYVYHAHHDPALDGDDSAALARPRRRLLPQQIAPGYDPREHAYGVALGWDF